MALIIQYDLLETAQESEMRAMRESIAAMQESLTKQRKKQFASIGEIKKMQMELDARMNIIEANLCRK